MQRAKEQGTRIITIDPVKSATAMKSDEYYPIKPTTDGYLALAMSNYIIENDLQDVEFIKKRTTAPFLVRQDTGMLLRKSDFEEVPEDADDEFYVWDPERSTAVLYGTGADPALEGSYEYEGITVTTSYTLLKEQLSQYAVSYTHLTLPTKA